MSYELLMECEDVSKCLDRIKQFYLISTNSIESLQSVIDEAYSHIFKLANKLKNKADTDPFMFIIGLECVKVLRNFCPNGSHVRDYISTRTEFSQSLRTIITFEPKTNLNEQYQFDLRQLKKLCWQLLSNVCVQNGQALEMIWTDMGDLLLSDLDWFSAYTCIKLMMIYNMFTLQSVQSKDKEIFKSLLLLLQQASGNNDASETGNHTEFIYILIEHFLTKYEHLVGLYEQSTAEHQVVFLYFVVDYIRNGSIGGLVQFQLLTHLTNSFKIRSDNILTIVNTPPDEINVNEVMAIIEVISVSSGEAKYSHIFKSDSSLFLNAGCLLKNIIQVGQSSDNLFTPLQSLHQAAPNSTSYVATFETVPTFELRKMLVRIIANLLFKNKANQDLAREMGFINAILDCTNIDARNPLVREWSILAIRNLCENNLENQKFIMNIKKINVPPNSILNEIDMSNGSFKIKSNE